MSGIRIAILAVAAIAAIGLAFIVRGMVTPKRAAPVEVAAAAKPVAQVLVAKHDLAIGARLTPKRASSFSSVIGSSAAIRPSVISARRMPMICR